MNQLEYCRRVKQAVETKILARVGITGVDLGYKITGGRQTSQPSIRIYVQEKRDVSARQRIPASIDGVPTDVIERRYRLHPLRVRAAEPTAMPDGTVYDPLAGGISVGPCREIDGYVIAGTLGVLVTDNATGRPMLLSNFHVLAVDGSGKPGDRIAQPSLVDGGLCPPDQVGELMKTRLGRGVDCAVASQIARGTSRTIVDLGEIAGSAEAAVGMAVMKRGRTTELTHGMIDSVDLAVKIDYGDGIGPVVLRNQISITVNPALSREFGAEGDSGSLVVNGSHQAVGLYFAGDDQGVTGVANPIGAVLAALGVSLGIGGGGAAANKRR